MANVGTIEITSVVSPEAKRELEELMASAGIKPGIPAVRGETMAEGRLIANADLKHFRDKYPDDELLQVFLDVIEDNIAFWEFSKRLTAAGIDMTGYQLRDWRMEHHHAVREPLVAELTLVMISKEGGLGGR